MHTKPMMLLVILALLCACDIVQVQSLPSQELTAVCHETTVPALKSRGVNQVDKKSTKPLFELKVTPRVDPGFPPTYEVSLVAQIEPNVFTDATIVISANGTCGKGKLQYDSNDFFQAQQDDSCPQLVLFSNRKSPMSSLPQLTWTPPYCGCVQFRAALVLAKGEYYYTEGDDVVTGPLVKRICLPEIQTEMSREQRLDGLCHVNQKHTSRDILSSAAFRKRHQLDIHYTDRLELEMALELRRADARMCCSKQSQAEKLKCFKVNRYRRADRFCQDGFPDIPFVSFRSKFMRSKERQCCSILGKYRYMCFAKDNQIIQGSDVTPMDFSLDASDPANDLAELGTMEDFNDFLEKRYNLSKANGEIVQRKESPRHGQDMNEQYKMKNETSITVTGSGNKLDANVKVKGNKTVNGAKSKIVIVTDESSSQNSKLYHSNVNSNNYFNSTELAESTSSQISSTSAPSIAQINTKVIPRQEQQRQSSDIFRRIPSDTEPNLSSSERRKYQRKMGGRSSNLNGDFRRSNKKLARNRPKTKSRFQKAYYYDEKPRYSERGSRMSTSAERQLRRRTSENTQEPLRGEMDIMEDFDDQGGHSVENTLKYLDLKMKRLELRRLCCQTGAIFGGEVSGSLPAVKEQCKHSSHKYLQREEISFGIKKCRLQFVKCCVNEAKMGLTMSSAEFGNKAYDNYMPNDHAKTEGLVRRHGLTRKDRRFKQDLGRDATTVGNAQDIVDTESDRRFESMRAEIGDPRFDLGEDWDDDEEYKGPRRFDDEDNKDTFTNYDDNIRSKRTRIDKNRFVVSEEKPTVRKNNTEIGDHINANREDVEVYESEDDDDNDEIMEKKKEDEDRDGDEKVYENINDDENDKEKKINKADIEVEEKEEENKNDIMDKRKKAIPTENFPKSHKLLRKSNDKHTDTSRKREKTNKSRDMSYRRIGIYNRSRERSRNGRFSNTSRRRRLNSSRRQEGGSSRLRRTWYNSNHGRRRHSRQEKGRRHHHQNKQYRKQIAMDSKEMAAENVRKIISPALDSSEMAAKYHQINGAMAAQRQKLIKSSREGGRSKMRLRRHWKKTNTDRKNNQKEF